MTNPNDPKDPSSTDERLNADAWYFSEHHDQASFTRLYRAVQRPLIEFLGSQRTRETDMEDTMSETALALWTQRESFSGNYPQWVSFVRTVAHHRLQEWRRKARRNPSARLPVVDEEDDTPYDGPEEADNGASPEDIAAVREAMRRLPAMERRVVEARTEGHTFEEIAQEMGVSNQRVCVVYEKALTRVRRGR